MVLSALSRAFVPALLCLFWACPASGTAASTYYLAVDGDDGNAGSEQAPWRSFQHAVDQLGPGDTLLVRGGVYFERDVRIDVAGTAAAPITIQNYPGESPVLDGGYAEFRTKGNSDWELYDAGKDLYRSKQTFPNAGAVGGYFGTLNKGWRLVPYESRATLSTDEEDYTDQAPYYYVGPGAYWDPADRRIYVRLEPGKYQAVVGTSVPGVTDPGDVRLLLFPQAELLHFEDGAAHIEVRGIDLRYAESAIEVSSGAHHLTVAKADVRAGRYAILLRDGCSDILLERLDIQGGFPDYVVRSDVKEPTPGRPAHLLQGAGLYLDEQVDRLEVRDCRFEELFDAIDATGLPRDVYVHHNEFVTIRDEVFQLSSAGYRIEFAYNHLERVAAGVSWEGNGAPPANQRATKYIHHNVIDASVPMLYGRSDPQGLLPSKWQGPAGDGMASGRAFGMHSANAVTGPDPWRIYHNTIVVTQDVDGRGAGHCYYLGPYDPSRPHAVYNNIFVQTAPFRVAREARVHDGSQVMDGNLYHRAVGGGGPLFLDFKNGGQTQDFASLGAFLASNYAQKTKNNYSPGWEAKGVQADPRLNSRYLPDPNGPAATGAVNLASKSWPGLVGEVFRGALNPIENQSPTADAGPDQDIKLAAFARLRGEVTDDGLPNPPGAVTIQWTQVGGPGVTTFGDPGAAETTATFSAVGRYVLQLKADDGEEVDKDQVVVDVD